MGQYVSAFLGASPQSWSQPAVAASPHIVSLLTHDHRTKAHRPLTPRPRLPLIMMRAPPQAVRKSPTTTTTTATVEATPRTMAAAPTLTSKVLRRASTVLHKATRNRADILSSREAMAVSRCSISKDLRRHREATIRMIGASMAAAVVVSLRGFALDWRAVAVWTVCSRDNIDVEDGVLAPPNMVFEIIGRRHSFCNQGD